MPRGTLTRLKDQNQQSPWPELSKSKDRWQGHWVQRICWRGVRGKGEKSFCILSCCGLWTICSEHFTLLIYWMFTGTWWLITVALNLWEFTFTKVKAAPQAPLTGRALKAGEDTGGGTAAQLWVPSVGGGQDLSVGQCSGTSEAATGAGAHQVASQSHLPSPEPLSPPALPPGTPQHCRATHTTLQIPKSVF